MRGYIESEQVVYCLRLHLRENSLQFTWACNNKEGENSTPRTLPKWMFQQHTFLELGHTVLP
jgi:hypothetical protein